MEYFPVGAENFLPLIFPEFIALPIFGISSDIIRNIQVRFFISDDMLMVIPLPDLFNIGVLPKPFCNADFKFFYDRTDGTGNHFLEVNQYENVGFTN